MVKDLMEKQSTQHLFLTSFLFLLFLGFSGDAGVITAVAAAAENAYSAVDVGVVLDLESLAGKKGWTSVSMGIDEFYASHPNFTTRLILHPRDSQSDVVGAASAALDLLKNVQPQAIIGPITSSEAEFVADLGNKSQVPIISYSASSPSLSSVRTPYFVRATLNDSSQVGAIASIVRHYGWREVVPLYEDTDYGAGIVPYLIDAFQAIDARVPYRSVIPPNASDDQIEEELFKLMTMQTRVFVVHMMPSLGSRLFLMARAAGLMSEGYAWITTDGITNGLDSLGPAAIDSMEGVIGVTPYVPKSNTFASFSSRWRSRFSKDHPAETDPPAVPNVFQLWAYDVAWALALAAENAGKLDPHSYDPPRGSNSSSATDLARLGVSRTGPQLLAAVRSTHFLGVSGEFRLVDGQLQSSRFEIVNVIGKGGRTIGFWSPEVGLSLGLDSSNSTLKAVMWPGDSTVVPKGWEIPTSGKRLQIGVPVKNGFNQFVNVDTDAFTGRVTVTGFCIDVFDAVMGSLGYDVPYDYVPYLDSQSYDELVYQVFLKRFDAVVGDTTIIANRSQYVDFTLPYTESGVSMIVPVKEDTSKNAWIFLKPLTTDLWLGSLAFFFFTGFVVWVIEHRINKEFRGPPSQQFGTIFYFSFSTLVFAHKERLESNLSRFAVIIWVFVVLILTSSYTASLTSMLTVQQLQPLVADVSELLKNGDYVGYQDGSFVGALLMQQLKFDKSKLKNYSTPDQYNDALLRGSSNGGVAAIFDEIPSLRLFFSEHCTDYAMVGRTYKTDGFGFVFPRGSLLVSDVSRAILNVTESDKMTAIEKKWFGDQTSCPTDSSSFSSSSLNFRSFGGLFLITGAVSMLALLAFFGTFVYKERHELKKASLQSSLWKRMAAWAQHYDRKDLTSHTFKKEHAISRNIEDAFNQNRHGESTAVTPNCEGSHSPFSIISNLSGMNCDTPEEGRSSVELIEPVMGMASAETAIEIAEIRGEN